jgi:hypothetical protein
MSIKFYEKSIGCCSSCPNLKSGSDNISSNSLIASIFYWLMGMKYCVITQKRIYDYYEIPTSCPLPDSEKVCVMKRDDINAMHEELMKYRRDVKKNDE